MWSRPTIFALLAALATCSAGCVHDGHSTASAINGAEMPVALSLSQGDAAGRALLSTNAAPDAALTSTSDQMDELVK